jgi:hypothetical protein
LCWFSTKETKISYPSLNANGSKLLFLTLTFTAMNTYRAGQRNKVNETILSSPFSRPYKRIVIGGTEGYIT